MMTLNVPAPLRPAGHLPHRWGDWLGVPASPNNSLRNSTKRLRGAKASPLVISPPVGEMAGRPEGRDLAPTSILSSREAHNVPRS